MFFQKKERKPEDQEIEKFQEHFIGEKIDKEVLLADGESMDSDSEYRGIEKDS